MKESLISHKPVRQQHDPRNATVRIGPLIELPALVRGLGYDPEPIFAAAGYKLAQFVDPDIEISYVSGSKLLARCATVTDCKHLGLLLGQRAGPSSLGVAGFVLQTSHDVGTALQGLVQHLDLHDRGAKVTLVTNNGRIFLEYAIHLSGVEGADQIYDMSMALACNIMRGLCGASWNPTEVLLPRQPPQDSTPYDRFFQAPICFNADQSTIEFPRRWLACLIPNADPVLHNHLEREANELHAHQQKSFVGELRRLLRKSLAIHQSSVKDIASQLGMHERTLNRRLREEGTNFSKELEDIRYEAARQLLSNTTKQLSQIATALDYADQTAFCRAFKQWSGNSPAEWRRQLNDRL